MALQPNLAPLEPLVGRWRGTGRGHYPTIADFTYVDEWEFLDVGKPFLWFIERTRHPETGAPMHTETGYVRVPAPGVVELVAAIPTGQSELGVGTLTAADGVLEVATAAQVRNTPAAKQVDGIRRRFRVTGDRLDYTLSMAAVGHADTPHLEATLTRA
jgi:hypothetical protein